MPFVEARTHLEKLPGIGPWTSGVVMGGPLGDPDALPIGDYHLANWVAWNLAGEPRADDERMEELLAPYAGRRGLVARLIKLGGVKLRASGREDPCWTYESCSVLLERRIHTTSSRSTAL